MELTIGTLIKLIIGILVVVAVVLGIYLLFKNSVFGIFGDSNNIGGTSKFILAFIK